MKILLIRHGESKADLLNVHEGIADFELTERGIKQAHRMAEWVNREMSPDIIWSSPLKRAKTTAQLLSELVGCRVNYDDDLMEWNNGVLAGLSRSDAAEKYPEPVGGHPPHQSVKGGESAIEFRSRAERILSKMVSESGSYKTIAVVSHGGLISRVIQSFLNLPMINDILIKTGDTGLHLLESRADGRLIHFINKSDHMNEKS